MNVRNLVALHWGIWIGLVIEFAVSQQGAIAELVALGGLVITAALITRRNPALGSTLIAPAALLGPLARTTVASVVLTAGDAVLAAIFIVFLTSIAEGRIRPQLRLPGPLACAFAGLLLLCWAFSIDRFASLIAMVNIAQLGCAFVMTTSTIKEIKDIRNIIKAWVGASAISCLTIIIAYKLGKTLLMGMQDSFAEQYSDLISSNEATFYRASYFYSGVIFPVAVGIIGSVILAIHARQTNLLRLIWWGLATVNGAAIALLGNLTAFIGTGFGLIAIIAISVRYKIRMAATTTAAVIGIPIALLSAGSLKMMMTDAQRELMTERFRGAEASESLGARVAIWKSVFDYMTTHPKSIVIGLGPDITTRAYDSQPVQSIMLSGQEGALDNGYIYAVVNFGVILVVVVGAAVLVLMWRLYSRLSNPDGGEGMVLFVGLAVWLLMSCTQQHGIAKPVMCVMQLLAAGITYVSICGWPMVRGAWARSNRQFTSEARMRG